MNDGVYIRIAEINETLSLGYKHRCGEYGYSAYI